VQQDANARRLQTAETQARAAEEAARAAEQQAQAARERRAELSTQLEEERAARATAEADLARERAHAAEMEERLRQAEVEGAVCAAAEEKSQHILTRRCLHTLHAFTGAGCSRGVRRERAGAGRGGPA